MFKLKNFWFKFYIYFLNINFKFIQVIINTIINQTIIQTDCGIITKISLNLFKSELGPPLKSSIIYKIELIQRNCKIIESNFDFFANKNNNAANTNNNKLEKNELYQKIPVKTNSHDKK